MEICTLLSQTDIQTDIQVDRHSIHHLGISDIAKPSPLMYRILDFASCVVQKQLLQLSLVDLAG
jgi:hypothetical protein